MARHAGGAMLQAVQSAAAAEMTDRDLLARFTEGDETAFAALVNRHGGMVLGVCRRMLPTVQDAEDACQATFLVLAKKAGSGQWQASVANWLYMTARRIASRANRAASRRARRESRSIPPVTTSTLDQMTGREAFATLDEELDRLPAIYREPLVLCYLEGLTRDEAAARLRVPPATLKSQLDRGRKRLGRALTRRGVSLGAGLLAVSATSRAGAVPARIGHSILASTRGTVPRSVAELCRGVAMNGTGTKALLLALALIGAAVLGVGAVSPMAGEQKPDRPIVKKADADGKQPTAKPEPPPARTYAGRVIGPDGKPMKGAAVFAFESAGPSDSTKARDRETVRTVADAQGKFRIRLPAGKTFMPSLFATAEGFGIGRVEVERDGATDDVSIQLIADNEITGRVTTTEGKPVAGARIKVERIVDDVTDLDELLYRFKFAERRDPIRERRSMPVWFAELGTTAVTDKDGAFRLNGGGRDRVLYVEVDADGFSSDRLIVVNRPKFDPKPFNDGAAKNAAAMPVRRALKSERLHGPSLDLIVEREKPIQGVVKDAETGKPRTGVKVHLWMPEQPRLRLNAVTDAKGQFQLRGVRKAASYTLVLDSDPDTRHVGMQVHVTDTPGYLPAIADIEVKKGVVITGKIIDTATKKPIFGYAMVAAMFDNKFVAKYPGLDLSSRFMSPTDKDGTFRIVTIPGPVLLMGGAGVSNNYKRPVADPKYPQYFDRREGFNGLIYFGHGGNVLNLVWGNSCKVLEIKEDAEIVTQDILVEPVE